jgi:DNA adenine methylase
MEASLPLKWHGGKHYLAERIIGLFPPRGTYTHFVEPFFGGGAVLFRHDPEGKSEVANDLNGELANFWRHLADDNSFAMFQRRIEAVPFSSEEFKKAFSERHHPERWTALDRAVQFFVRYRQSRQGLGDCFATLSRNRTRRGMNEQVSSWLAAIEGLPAAHERLKRVVILNDYACSVIRQQDGPKTLYYLDPPYLHSTRSVPNAYEYEMTETEHVELLGVLSAINGKFLLSGYRSELYDKIADKAGWRRVDIQIDNKASSAKTKEIKTECVWMNY